MAIVSVVKTQMKGNILGYNQENALLGREKKKTAIFEYVVNRNKIRKSKSVKLVKQFFFSRNIGSCKIY